MSTSDAGADNEALFIFQLTQAATYNQHGLFVRFFPGELAI